MRRLLTNTDFLAGGLFVLFGALFFLSSARFERGSANQMGPGYFPQLLSAALLLMGVIQVVRSARSSGGESASPSAFSVRPVLFVLAAMIVFAATLERIGLVLAAILLVTVAGVVAPGRRWFEVAAAAIGLAAFSALVFVKGLGVYIPLWPELP